ncbi:MAG TPA: type VI secretion system protein TssA [Planctomycetota bacterium]|nr:type VI secretion system protein TssA [Planctomycetota bacterium]
MAILDVEKFVTELSPEAPCGEDLTYDPAYLELERLAQRTPERQVGDAIIPAEEPNWRQVADAAVELLGRTKDLRIIIHATLAALKLEGLNGLSDGLAVLRGFVERYWETVHPQLDPEDPDPLERINIIAALIDAQTFIRGARETPLCGSPQLGRFSLRDIMLARGEPGVLRDRGTPPADPAQIDAAFKDTPTDVLQANAQAVAAAVAQVQAMDDFLTETIGANQTRDLTPFRAILERMGKELQGALAQRGIGAPAPATEAAGEAAAGQQQAAGPSGPALSGDIRSPQEVLLAMDKICRYYEFHEPSSPVPLLVRGAQRLVSKSFTEIIQVLTPDAIHQIESICGLDSGSEAG